MAVGTKMAVKYLLKLYWYGTINGIIYEWYTQITIGLFDIGKYQCINSNDQGVVLHAHLSTSCLPNKWYVCMYVFTFFIDYCIMYCS